MESKRRPGRPRLYEERTSARLRAGMLERIRTAATHDGLTTQAWIAAALEAAVHHSELERRRSEERL